jgi:Acyl-CoA reductase (LuxC)
MNLQQRINLLARLGNYMLSTDEEWQKVKERASRENSWFIPQFIDLSVNNIAQSFLDKDKQELWSIKYELPQENKNPRVIGIVMAGNIPLVGFHDLLCVFISGHKAMIKPSSKDEILVKHLVKKLIEWDPESNIYIQFSERLKNCGAYIATGGNNSSRYFEYYFGKYPHIIRRNRTSVAILTGKERNEDLEKLADDVYQYFGLGCRNVTKIYVPREYDFVGLLEAFKKYNHLADHSKYRNNYDYHLAIHILNNRFYMSNSSIMLVEDVSVFSPISQLNFEYYEDKEQLVTSLKARTDLQCIIGKDLLDFGTAQSPSVTDYADGIDTLKFLVLL